jgi:hypothetical protein
MFVVQTVTPSRALDEKSRDWRSFFRFRFESGRGEAILQEKKDYKVLRWLGSLPMYLIGASLPWFILRGPLVKWIFYSSNGNPISEEEISGPLSFIYVLVVRTLMHIIGLAFASFVAASPLRFIYRFSWLLIIWAILNFGMVELFDVPIASNGDDPVYIWTNISLGLIYGIGGLYFIKWIKG